MPKSVVGVHRCGRTGKRSFRLESEAVDALCVMFVAFLGGDLSRRERWCYFCKACAGWHVTSYEPDSWDSAALARAARTDAALRLFAVDEGFSVSRVDAELGRRGR